MIDKSFSATNYQESGRSGTSPILFLIVFICSVCFARGTFAFEEIQMATAPRFISSSLTHEAGVWCSRPDPVDERISDLLALHGIHTLADYAAWLDKNIRYEKGPTPERWLQPDEVFRSRHGDCKDYSVLNGAVLKVLGYRPILLAIETDSFGHAVCAFRRDGCYAFFNNGDLVVTQAGTFDEFAAYLFRRVHFTKLMEINPKTKNTSVLVLA